jgi:predicted acylesterase/phospholipase RssA
MSRGQKLEDIMNARHLVIGAGGSRAFLTGLGAVLALRLGGLKDWSTIGGVSGGSIPALFMAAGLNPLELIERLQKLDFSKLMKSSPDREDVMFLLCRRRAGQSAQRLVALSPGCCSAVLCIRTCWAKQLRKWSKNGRKISGPWP